MKFHEKLYLLRKNARMTQLELAEKLDVSRQAVSRWEMGTAMPDLDNLIAMSDLFSVSLDYMLKEQTEPDSAGDPIEEPSGEQPQKTKYSWMVIPLVTPLIALNLLLYGWLFEKDALCDIGAGMLVLSLFGIMILLSVLLIRSYIRKIKK